jgi:glutamate 5-kinase
MEPLLIRSDPIRRIVVKVGSSSVTEDNRALSHRQMSDIAQLVASLTADGVETILVSSGAVAAGTHALQLATKPTTVSLKQSAAAIGQGLLMQTYTELFRQHGLLAAQILLTRYDFSRRQSYNNALDTLEALLSHRAVPVINENDTVVLSDHSFGDNDMLSALVAALVHADLLIILTDVDGLYDADPRVFPSAKRIPLVTEVTDALRGLATGSGSRVGTGGMAAKVRAAERALGLGVPVFVGTARGSLAPILAGEGAGTYFGEKGSTTAGSSSPGRKLQWIAFHSPVSGRVTIDEGAARAVRTEQRSLLPAGVITSEGSFNRGDVVELYSSEGLFIGRGIVNYTSSQLTAALGRPTSFARESLGVARDEVVHRDDLAVMV